MRSAAHHRSRQARTRPSRDVPIPNPAVAARPADDGWLVLVNLDTGRSLALNPTAAAIWRLVDGRRAPADIAKELGRQFADVPAHLLDDVAQVLLSFSEGGLVGYGVAERGRLRRSRA
jgi:hypothetical protein